MHTSTLSDLPPAHVFAVTSGKGGVGKTNIVANLAAALARMEKRVTVLDGNLGLANLNLFLGVNPQYTLADFFAGACLLADILTTGRLGITLLPAASGVPSVSTLSHEQKIAFLTELDALMPETDLVLVDTGSGISDVVTYFASAAQEIVVVVTPEPTSLTDACALITVLASTHQEKRFWVLANQVDDEYEARRLYDTFSRMVFHSLPVSLDLLGWIPHDQELVHAVTRCQMVVSTSPECPASLAFVTIAQRLLQITTETVRVKGGVQFLFRRMLAASLPRPTPTHRTH